MDPTITEEFKNDNEKVPRSILDIEESNISNDFSENVMQDKASTATVTLEPNQEYEEQKDVEIYVEKTSAESLDNTNPRKSPYRTITNQSDCPQITNQDEQAGYNSEYMLEHQSENVYMPDKTRGDDNVTEEPSCLSEDVSEQVHDEYICEKQQSSGTRLSEPYVGPTNENFVSQYETENIDGAPSTNLDEHETVAEVDSQISQQEENIKVEYMNMEKEYENISESDNKEQLEYCEGTALDKSNHEASIDEVLIIEESAADDTGENGIVDITHDYDVKKYTNVNVNSLEVIGDETVMDTEELHQDTVADHNNSEVVENSGFNTTVDESNEIQSYGAQEVTEVQGGYTIIEGPDSVDISTTSETVASELHERVLISQDYPSIEEPTNPLADEHEYLSEVLAESESIQLVVGQSSQSLTTPTVKKTFTKPVSEMIPKHLLGHNISKPIDNIPNGRQLPKPRLGVKVPYRNLVSQIVSKEEIEKEIMERSRQKHEATSKGDNLFARSLTQRLAKKIAPKKNPKTKQEMGENNAVRNTQFEIIVDNSKIQNDSDLLAILEGEGDELPDLAKGSPEKHQGDESTIKQLEREIALQQLQELPNQEPKQRMYRGRCIKEPVLPTDVFVKIKNTGNEKLDASPNAKKHPIKERNDQVSQIPSPKKETNISPPSPKKQPVEIEPQVKVNMVLKTYSRKRKTADAPDSYVDLPPPKKPMYEEYDYKIERTDPLLANDIYVTKSSRIIKRKVIWDPDDDAVSRSPRPSLKPVDGNKTSSAKSVKSPEVNLSSEKMIKEKVIEKKAATKEKLQERKIEKPKKSMVESKKYSEEKRTLVAKPDVSKNRTPIKNKKSLTEVDKLLMDEGAVKMLYELKNTDETVTRKKKSVYSVEKAHKDIIKKANQIKNELELNTSNESQKTLRKKEGVVTPVKPAGTTERKMSKDSTFSSVHTPPRSPAFPYQHSQGSMLIRRRSSSSMSSGEDSELDLDVKVTRKKSDGSKLKKNKKNFQDSAESAQEEDYIKESLKREVKVVVSESKLSKYESFTVKKADKHVKIDLNYNEDKCYFTVEVLEELTSALKKFGKDKDCNVLSVTSSGEAFCLGLDYSSLVSTEENERFEIATELAGRLRDFLMGLLHFPKILIAGIQGDCVGLGVTMLPLFDMVIASDTSTFSTPYASLGCMSEAGFLLTFPNLTNHGLAAELLYTSQKLTADDAFRRGLISRLCWPEKYKETLKNTISLISKGSKQSLEATKKQLRSHIIEQAEAAINSEADTLIQHWISSECQKSFSEMDV